MNLGDFSSAWGINYPNNDSSKSNALCAPHSEACPPCPSVFGKFSRANVPKVQHAISSFPNKLSLFGPFVLSRSFVSRFSSFD